MGAGDSDEMLVRSGIFSKLSRPAQAVFTVIRTMCDDQKILNYSQRAIARFAGTTQNSVIAAVEELELWHIITIIRPPTKKGIRQKNRYQLHLDHPQLLKLMGSVHRVEQADIDREKQLRAEDRKARSHSKKIPTSLTH